VLIEMRRHARAAYMKQTRVKQQMLLRESLLSYTLCRERDARSKNRSAAARDPA